MAQENLYQEDLRSFFWFGDLIGRFQKVSCSVLWEFSTQSSEALVKPSLLYFHSQPSVRANDKLDNPIRRFIGNF